MEKNVSRGLAGLEVAYDNVPAHIKEYAGLPERFFQLNQDQQRFIDVFAESAFFPVIEKLEYECDNLKDIAEQLTEKISEND